MVDKLAFSVVLEGAHTHAHFARFPDVTGFQGYVESPAHPIVVEKIDVTKLGSTVVDYGS